MNPRFYTGKTKTFLFYTTQRSAQSLLFSTVWLIQGGKKSNHKWLSTTATSCSSALSHHQALTAKKQHLCGVKLKDSRSTRLTCSDAFLKSTAELQNACQDPSSCFCTFSHIDPSAHLHCYDYLPCKFSSNVSLLTSLIYGLRLP